MNNNTSIASSGNNSSLKINTCTIGFEEFGLEKGVSIYPNPNNGEFYIEFEKETDNIAVEMQDILGQQILNRQLTQLKAGTKVILSVPGTAGAIYILKIRSDKGEMIKKITTY